MSPGEDKAWEILKGMDPAEVCRRTISSFEGASGVYLLKSFSMDLQIDMTAKRIYCEAPDGDLLLERLGYFSKLSILWYLVGAMDVPLSGRLVKPESLKGGQSFFRGTHVLPLDRLASKYDSDADGFFRRGERLGGMSVKYGDSAIQLFPFPRVPVVIILWRGDEEFPPRADLLFDSTSEFHLALDVLWSVAMESILIMMS